jgi:hypothetical protein
MPSSGTSTVHPYKDGVCFGLERTPKFATTLQPCGKVGGGAVKVKHGGQRVDGGDLEQEIFVVINPDRGVERDDQLVLGCAGCCGFLGMILKMGLSAKLSVPPLQ